MKNEQKITSNEQKLTSKEQNVTSNKQKLTTKQQNLTSNEQKLTNNEQKVTSNEQKLENNDQRAKTFTSTKSNFLATTNAPTFLMNFLVSSLLKIKDTINPLQLFIFTNIICCSRLPL